VYAVVADEEPLEEGLVPLAAQVAGRLGVDALAVGEQVESLVERGLDVIEQLLRRLQLTLGLGDVGCEPALFLAEEVDGNGHRVVAVYLAAAVPLVGERASNETAGEFVARQFLLAIILLVIVGTVNWVIARVRNRPKSYWRAVFRFGTMALTVGLVALSFVGRQSQDDTRGAVPGAPVAHRDAPGLLADGGKSLA
jgi:hypothetical protein